MHQLTGLDAAFLAMETSAVYGHVGSICVLDPSTAPQPLTLERLQELVASRLHLVPPFRRRLAEVPFGFDQPYWIEDPDFDIEFHVRELALPAPGDDRQLTEQAARLHAHPLDRRRPLWELYLISGLSGGRLAVYIKVHHAAIDGVSGNDILAAMLDLSPEGRDLGEVPPWRCDDVPSPVELLARSMLWLAQQPLRAARLSASLAASLPVLALSAPARACRSSAASCRAGEPAQCWSSPACARRARRSTGRSHRTGAGPSAPCRSTTSRPSSGPPGAPSTTSSWR